MHGGGVGGGAAFEDAEELRDPWQVEIILVQLFQNWYWSLQFRGNRGRFPVCMLLDPGEENAGVWLLNWWLIDNYLDRRFKK